MLRFSAGNSIGLLFSGNLWPVIVMSIKHGLRFGSLPPQPPPLQHLHHLAKWRYPANVKHTLPVFTTIKRQASSYLLSTTFALQWQGQSKDNTALCLKCYDFLKVKDLLNPCFSKLWFLSTLKFQNTGVAHSGWNFKPLQCFHVTFSVPFHVVFLSRIQSWNLSFKISARYFQILKTTFSWESRCILEAF